MYTPFLGSTSRKRDKLKKYKKIDVIRNERNRKKVRYKMSA